MLINTDCFDGVGSYSRKKRKKEQKASKSRASAVFYQ